METTIRLSGKLADLLGSDAQREGIPLDVLAARRLVESVLLWRIRTASPLETLPLTEEFVTRDAALGG